ncbi:hypothetical protein ACO1O0_007040 [Amphichorda felina]
MAQSGTSWAQKPPYRAPPEDFQPKLLGRCHCGQVKYLLRRDAPLASKFCHCDDCKSIHGAPFQWAAIFHKTDMAFYHLDPTDLQFYNSMGEGNGEEVKPPLPCKVRCSKCGTLLLDEGRNMVLLFLTTLRFPSEEARRKFDVQ